MKTVVTSFFDDVVKKSALNKNVVTALGGIAGTGKSTAAFEYAKLYNSYRLCFHSHHRKKAAMENGEEYCVTSCSAMCVTEGQNLFWSKLKDDVEAECYVIDEWLLTDHKTMDFIRKFIGKTKFIITFDMAQVVSQGINRNQAADFLNNDFIELFKSYTSYRGTDAKTRELTEKLGRLAEREPLGRPKITNIEKKNLKHFPYKRNALYVVETKEMERRLYSVWNLRAYKDDLDTVVKGHAAANESVNKSKLRLTAQADFEKKQNGMSVLQVTNIGTPHRIQGMETGGDVYFIIQKKRSVRNDALYVAFTRARDYRKFHIVIIEELEKKRLMNIYGKPIKDYKIFEVSEDMLQDVNLQDKTEREKFISDTVPKEATADGTVYKQGVIALGKGTLCYSTIGILDADTKSKNGSRWDNFISILRRSPEAEPMECLMEDFYEKYSKKAEEYGLPYIPAPIKIQAVSFMDEEFSFTNNAINAALHNPDAVHIKLDMAAAYYTILAEIPYPEGFEVSEREDEYDMNLYYIIGTECYDGLVTGEFVEFLLRENMISKTNAIFICSIRTNKMPCDLRSLKSWIFRCKENKATAKTYKAGILADTYLHAGEMDETGDIMYFIRESSRRYQLLFAVMCSRLALYLYTAKKRMEECHMLVTGINVDAISFLCHRDDADKLPALARLCWGDRPMQYETNEGGNSRVLWRNYELPTAVEYDRMKARERQRKRRALLKP